MPVNQNYVNKFDKGVSFKLPENTYILVNMQFRIHMKFRLPYEPLCNEFSYTPKNSSTYM